MNNFFEISKKIKILIKRASSILLISHQNPDGDALGSLCFFISYLESIGKNYCAFCLNKISFSFDFLAGAEKISSDFEKNKLSDYDLIIILDAGDFRQIGLEKQFKDLLTLKITSRVKSLFFFSSRRRHTR